MRTRNTARGAYRPALKRGDHNAKEVKPLQLGTRQEEHIDQLSSETNTMLKR